MSASPCVDACVRGVGVGGVLKVLQATVQVFSKFLMYNYRVRFYNTVSLVVMRRRYRYGG